MSEIYTSPPKQEGEGGQVATRDRYIYTGDFDLNSLTEEMIAGAGFDFPDLVVQRYEPTGKPDLAGVEVVVSHGLGVGKARIDQVIAKHQGSKLVADQKMQQLRDNRDQMLADTDWTVLPDSPVDKTAWTTYRQELRDLPGVVKDPDAIAWPVPPSSPQE